MGHDFKFWGTVGAVMTALKLKDAYDDCEPATSAKRRGTTTSRAYCPRSPIDEEHGTHQEDLELDTTLPTIARPKRKRHADCCCCAYITSCGIFWKAFGAVLSLVFVWQTLRFIFWSAKPTPTGLEKMPKFNTSLECKNAVYTFNPDATTYSVPFNVSRASHTVQLQGDAFGTFIITEGAQDATAIKYDLVLKFKRRDTSVRCRFQVPHSRNRLMMVEPPVQATLDTPVSISGADGSSCAHFDIVLYVPPQLKELTIFSSSLVHLKFASRTRSGITLDKLEISVDSPHQNLILPTTSIRANDLRLLVRKGYLVGDVSIVDSTTLETRYGDAVANVHVYPSSEEGLDDAKLTTNTGDGRADFFFMPPTPPSSSSSSKHTASGVGDLYLKYERSGFSGRISLKAGSATTRNMHAIDYHKSFTRGWVREEDGKDRLNIKAGRNTWVGLYF
ncbi:hypothetical protein BC629DRAFT_1303228 [Irpex lacteus]|nr:hypothetical protein BC629DRAFT_1303228 [Irpex lacteus]